MSLSRRLALLDWAQRAGAWIVEDDYDSEFRYAGRPLAALQGLDRGQRVLYVGTFSKVLFPALRLGYLVAPPDLVNDGANELCAAGGPGSRSRLHRGPHRGDRQGGRLSALAENRGTPSASRAPHRCGGPIQRPSSALAPAFSLTSVQDGAFASPSLAHRAAAASSLPGCASGM